MTQAFLRLALLAPALLLAQPATAQVMDAPSHKGMPRAVPCHPKAQAWIGKRFAPDGRVAGPGEITPAMLPPWNRIIRPGDGVTRDAIAERLNLMLDEQGYIAGMYCG
ncbi:MAG: hypothetical protein J0L97_04865 [Alphaproteobacteria bacterium]|nr:hypothetical protein [Alphaproteobacteria bacterium]